MSGKNKPEYSSSLVLVGRDQVVPEALLQILCKENPTALGFMVREAKGFTVEKFPKIDDPAKNYEELKLIMKGRLKFPAMFCFHDFISDFDEDEVQPFIALRDSKNNPLLGVGIEGDFPNYIDKSPDKFSEAYCLMQDWLGPKIEQMYKSLGNNPGKLIDYLRTQQFQSDFGNVIGHRGVLTFMPVTGDPFLVEKNDIGVEGKWGSASNAYGYTEPVEVVAEPSTQAAAPKRSKYAVEDAATEVKAEPAKIVKAEVVVKPATVVEKVAAEFIEEEVFPPKDLQGKPLKSWYRKMNGDPEGTRADSLPENWKEHPAVKVRTSASGKTDVVADTAMAAALEKAKTNIPKDMRAPSPTAVGETMPVISGPMQKSATEFIKKHLGDGSAVIDDPIKANDEERKLATFAQCMAGSGVKSIEDLNRWRASFIFAFTKNHPETAALALIEQRHAIADLRKQLASGDKTLGELTGTDQTTTPDGTTPPALPDGVHLVPAKKETPSEQPIVRQRSKYA